MSTILNPRDANLIKHFLVGGAALGGGTAMAVSLANYLKGLRQEAEPPVKTDADTLYINMRPSKKPGDPDDKMASTNDLLLRWLEDGAVRLGITKKASVGASLAMAGGVLGAGASYAAVHQMYQDWKKRQLQKQLEAAQQGYVDVLHDSVAKGAAVADGKPLGLPEAAVSMPGTAATLLALAAGVVTNKMLSKTFPTPKPPGRRDPRRVVIRPDPDEELDKEAALRDGMELVVRLLQATKSASLQSWQDVIHGLGQGRHREFADGLINYDWDTAATMLKGASAQPTQEPHNTLGISVGLLSNLTGPAIKVATWAEFNDAFPVHAAIARVLPEDMQETLVKIAGVFGAELRHTACSPFASAWDAAGLVKDAGLALGMLDDVLFALTANNVANHKKPTGDHNAVDPDDSQPSDEAGKTEVQTRGREAQRFADQHRDQINAAISA